MNSYFRKVKEASGWLTKQHPNVISFFSTFLSVFLAATLAWVVNSNESKKDANNLLKVMYFDCTSSLDQVDDVRESIRAHLGLTQSGSDVFEDVAEIYGINNKLSKQEKISRILNDLGKLPKLSEFDPNIFNGVPLPSTMINALDNNIKHYSAMHELTYSEILRLLPDMTGLHGGYHSLRNEAKSILLSNGAQLKSNEALIKIVAKDADEQGRFSLALNALRGNFKQMISESTLKAIYSIDSYRHSLFWVCHHLEKEWELRECGISEEQFQEFFDKQTLYLAANLSCD